MKGYSEILRRLLEDLQRRGSLLVSFSGGVDSSVVAYLAYKALKDNSLAVTIKSPLTPSGEIEDAKKVAKEIGIKHLIVPFNELKIPGFNGNPPNRCYLCKKARFRFLKKLAAEKGFRTVADGTNLDDLKEYRPGNKALKEEGIYSPLAAHGLGKRQVREIASTIGLSVASKPSNTCLATRFPYGCSLDLESLRRVDLAEAYLKRKFELKKLRVRSHGNLARIEISKDELEGFLERLREARKSLIAKFRRLGFTYITLDLEGYRLGSFDVDILKADRNR